MTKSDNAATVEYALPLDWRGERIAQIRELILRAEPGVIEEVKWKTRTNPGGVLVWYQDGMICTGEVYKKHLRLTFAKGAQLKDVDPTGILNTHRAAVMYEADVLDDTSFVELIKAAVALNRG